MDPGFRHKVFHQKKQSHLTGGKTYIKQKRRKQVGQDFFFCNSKDRIAAASKHLPPQTVTYLLQTCKFQGLHLFFV